MSKESRKFVMLILPGQKTADLHCFEHTDQQIKRLLKALHSPKQACHDHWLSVSSKISYINQNFLLDILAEYSHLSA